MLSRFIIYGILGWALEIFWTGLGSFFRGNWELAGFTYLWMFPIYGLAVFMEPIHYKIKDIPWYFRGVIWAFIIFSIEYTTGWLLDTLLGACPWDYSTVSDYHLHGYIRLDYLPAWFVVGLLFERTHAFLDKRKV